MFVETGSVLDKPHSRGTATTTTDENTEFVGQMFAQNQGMSIQRSVLELSINKSTIKQMLQKMIKKYRYGLQAVPMLQAEDYDAHGNK